jgi:hypothetical protein
MMKKCNRCKELKSFDNFHKNKVMPDGLSHYCKPCRKKFYQENENCQIYDKKYRENNCQLIKTKRVKAYQRDKVKIANRKKEEYQRNKAKHNERIGRRLKNIQYKIKSNLSRRIRSFLKKKEFNLNTLNLLGCNLSFFKDFIENKFQKGMSWDNYGLYGWHLDHIRPCSSFDLTNQEDVRICFHYTNFQPLWAKDNLSKGAKFSNSLNS